MRKMKYIKVKLILITIVLHVVFYTVYGEESTLPDLTELTTILNNGLNIGPDNGLFILDTNSSLGCNDCDCSKSCTLKMAGVILII